MHHYFKKELISNRVRTASGDAIPFEDIGGDCGVIAVDDDDPVGHEFYTTLSEKAAKRRGGVIKITQAQFDELKKKTSLPASNAKQPARQSPRLHTRFHPFGNKKDAAPADAPASRPEPVASVKQPSAATHNPDLTKSNTAAPVAAPVAPTNDLPSFGEDEDFRPKTSRASTS